MVERLTTDLGFRRIAILYQDDSYGKAGLVGVRRALYRRDMDLVAEGVYMRNTVGVKRALLHIREGNPQAVIIIGAYRPAAHFIKWARKIEMRAVFMNLSFVGSNALLNELGRAGDGVVVTQVVPFPWDAGLPVVARYHSALEAVDPAARPGFVSLEGYLVGRLVIHALRAAAGPGGADGALSDRDRFVHRENFLHALEESGDIDLDGFAVKYGPGDNQGSDRVFLTVIRRGRFASVTRLSR